MSRRFLGIALVLAGVLSGCATEPVQVSRKGLFDLLADGAAPNRLNSREEESRDVGPARETADAAGFAPVNLAWPLAKVRVTSPFGPRGSNPHDGIDLQARKGTPVYASADGKVIYSGAKISGYGQMVVIRHASRLSTVYAHASRLLVKKGQRVKQGQLIALSGATGQTRGAHLHFEVRRGSDPLNPASLIPPTRLAKAPGAPARLPAQKRS